ncbi:ImmA/IrrE family metallo-endopeptidase [Megalodesulfovibrio paquesii]
MSIKKRQAIQQLAANVFSKLNLSTPVNVDSVVKQLGGEIIQSTDSSYEARIQKNGDQGFTIELNDSAISHDGRRRFTIAHELGHLFLHMGYIINPEKWNRIDTYTDSPYYRQGYTEEEMEAHEFAAALLMPTQQFTPVFLAVPEFRTAITNAAIHFGVTDKAAKTRAKWLGLMPWEYE